MGSRRYQNKKHLAWVHNYKCILSFTLECDGLIDAHHLMRPWNGHRGMGMKSGDENIVPLCSHHHRALHHNGNEDNFFERTADDRTFGKRKALEFWIDSPYNDGKFL